MRVDPTAARQEFASRLQSRLDQLGIPRRRQINWFQSAWRTETGERLSPTCFRKWLSADALPRPERLPVLARLIGLNPSQLHHPAYVDDIQLTKPVMPCLDAQMLSQCMHDVESVLQRTGDHISVAERAEVVSALYEQRVRTRKGQFNEAEKAVLTLLSLTRFQRMGLKQQ